MYKKFFGLKEKPFSITPDPSFLFLSETHQEALNHLLYGINNTEGFIMITGDVGSGKTTLCRCLLQKIEADIKISLILNPILSAKELIASILQDFGVKCKKETKKELIDKLNHFLLDQLAKDKRPALIIIDEAQDLTSSLLEQVRLLSNLETNKEKLVQIVLIGQNELRDKLNLPELRQLNQRITVRYELEYLNQHETETYLYHRLTIAGANGRVYFQPKAINEIYQYSKGIPRLINIAADRALLTAYLESSHKISKQMVSQGIASINSRRGKTSRKKRFSLFLFSILILIGILLYIFSLIF